MAAATRSFGPEREAEPAKEARVVGSELVDTYTVCWGAGAKPGVAAGARSAGRGGAGLWAPRPGEWAGARDLEGGWARGSRKSPGRGCGGARARERRAGLGGLQG